ncbi:hypothetical protein RFI_13680 [Reticulomyxa filosa]|uniref:Transmembrane protein n=1 Tax=Reticulomyxa filosa TaxID=46433 RepID=X6NDT2_RETFI|nr:hypothetical protein RFI_13680 [Reticulomyxa filosa]|eukprot:ETO23502.1 hypothetical protein RFI_13680 [Reticulomyxa filosa]
MVSVCYHVAEALPNQRLFGLHEGEWHKLDNIAAISCCNVLFIYLCNLSSPHVRYLWGLIQLGIVVVLQTHSPWDLLFTLVPIFFHLLVFLVKYFFFEKYLYKSVRPTKWNVNNVKSSFFWLVPAIICFCKGLDDEHDYLRLWHGAWHAFLGISSYYQWGMIDTTGERKKEHF